MCVYLYNIMGGNKKSMVLVLFFPKRIKIVETFSGCGERDDLWLLCVGSVVIE